MEEPQDPPQHLHPRLRQFGPFLSGVFAITVGNYFTILELLDPAVPPHNHTKSHKTFSSAVGLGGIDTFDPYGGSSDSGGGSSAWDMYTGRIGQLHS